MARSNNNEQDIHDRHPDEGSEEQASAVGDDETVNEASTGKPGFKWPGKNAKERQEIRDAHFKENGVKADLTGGKVPGEE